MAVLGAAIGKMRACQPYLVSGFCGRSSVLSTGWTVKLSAIESEFGI